MAPCFSVTNFERKKCNRFFFIGLTGGKKALQKYSFIIDIPSEWFVYDGNIYILNILI